MNDQRAAAAYIRLFISDEPISIKNLKNLCDDPNLSDQWKTEFNRIKYSVNSYFDSSLPFVENTANKLAPPRRYILGIFLNGYMFHLKDISKHEVFSNWKLDDVYFGFLSTEISSIFRFLCSVISALSAISKSELPSKNNKERGFNRSC